jgi:hypothetical protein
MELAPVAREAAPRSHLLWARPQGPGADACVWLVNLANTIC